MRHGLAVGGDGVLGLAETLVREAEIVASLDVSGIQAEAGEKGLASIVCAVEVVVGPAEEIPGAGVGGGGPGGEQEPALGVGEVLQQDIVRGDDGEFVGGWVAKRCGIGEGGERVCGAALAEEGGAKQEAGLGIGGGGGDEGAEAGLGGGELAAIEQGACLLEGIEGGAGNGLGGRLRQGEEAECQGSAAERAADSPRVERS